ncbi:NAD(P)-dependent oxidoreductase [Mycetocola zhujimingii]|uniref:Nucleoside-diphosphate sugar epimerase n=1 Tax=Mycetocola zhujimingii TaxID=2079792 RepID=A0A2U1THH2_9MICO|nr:NAD(P)H-binding protein [Mycetocola zhujimingii]PWC08328.1 nucleoside-diphosphate sugar epimerase [Mycetocola zhujimingii]
MKHSVSQKLRVAVLGATGATGRHVVAAGLRSGHDVVALTRRPRSFEPSRGLTEFAWPDVTDPGPLADAFMGVDAVISTIGGPARGPATVCTDAIDAAVPAMVKAGVSRLIVVSAHGVLESHDRSLFSILAWAGVGEKLKDKETMEPLITSSGLEWTIVRPPTLKNAPPAGNYKVGEDLPIRLWHAIGRADLAAFLIHEAEVARFVRQYPRIHR